jgi:hypothetical protein
LADLLQRLQLAVHQRAHRRGQLLVNGRALLAQRAFNPAWRPPP